MPERTVAAYFDDRNQAERAVDELKIAGFAAEEISLGASGHGFLDAILPRTERDDATKVTVASSRPLEAAAILHRMGGHDQEQPAGTPQAVDANGGDGKAPGEVQVIELLEEEPVPRLVPTEVGEVRVTKVVQTETRVVEVPVRREELVVERVPVPASARGSSAAAAEVGDVDDDERTAAFRGEAEFADPSERRGTQVSTMLGADEEVIRVSLLEEQVVITLQPVVREEVLIRKRRVSEAHVETVEIRREELQVNRTGEAEVEEIPVSANGGGEVA